LLTCYLVACDNGAQQNQATTGKHANSTKNNESNLGDKEEEIAQGSNQESESNEANTGSNDLDDWCKKAEEISVVDKKLSPLLAKMCKNGKATKLLRTTLLSDSQAYAGSGSPKLINIEPIAGDKTYSTAFFALSIKLPIEIEKHFEKVGPKGGDPEAQIKLAKDNGATAEFEVKDEYNEDGKYHVRGWKFRSKNTKKVSIINVVTESISRSDQFQLSKGDSYMYTQYVIEGLEGVQEYSLLTAGVKVSSGSYLLATAKIKVNNKGLPEIAEGQITTTAKDLIKSMYKAADEVK
jgi:hypothetical protein